MSATQVEFNSLMRIKEPGKIQMIARLGRSGYRYFQPWRPIQSMVVN